MASTVGTRCGDKPVMLTPESVTAHKGGYGSHDLTAECWFRGKGARNSHICISSTKTCFLVFKLVNMPEMSEISLPGVPCRRISAPVFRNHGQQAPANSTVRLRRRYSICAEEDTFSRKILNQIISPARRDWCAGLGRRFGRSQRIFNVALGNLISSQFFHFVFLC